MRVELKLQFNNKIRLSVNNSAKLTVNIILTFAHTGKCTCYF